MKVIPEVTIETIKARISAGDASRKIATDHGVFKGFVNKERETQCQQTHQDRNLEHHSN